MSLSPSELLGTPRTVDWRGKRLVLPPLDIHCENLFADWVKTEAALDLWKLKAKTPPDFYAEQLRIYNSKVSGKQFEWGKEDVHNAAWSDAGQRQLIFIKIQRGAELGGEILEREEVDALATDADKWNEFLMILYQQDFPDFFAYLQKQKAVASKTRAPSPPA